MNQPQPRRSKFDPSRVKQWLQGHEVLIDLSITGLVLCSIAIFVIQTYPIPAELRVVLDRVNVGILITFAVEYLLRLWAAERKWKYFFSVYSLIDLLTIVPFFIGLVDISFIRVFRWFRILRLFRFFENRAWFGRFTTNDTVIFARILLTLLAILFVYSGLIYQAEHDLNSENFQTFLDAFYYAVVTMTTVGFGDITPISEVGRLLTVLMIFTGIALIPWQVGDFIRQLIKSANQRMVVCSTCGLAAHDLDARCCKHCGAPLPIPLAKTEPGLGTNPENTNAHHRLE
ncbi:ion transporter [Synechococcus sp. PCC 6312]|uniref:ion transporter n=1 Tax=Synechococcus sp. (strain ATCC 27167 / PCC 6312) TaxID=195253 RepID=UPI00029ED617|nr:ion transporter [Synechococcus sp. PCC 6312]AFY60774.1 Kef-type K+ ransport system, predicted NAD-binding component [Synechococcus sp. PCC 6312]